MQGDSSHARNSDFSSASFLLCPRHQKQDTCPGTISWWTFRPRKKIFSPLPPKFPADTLPAPFPPPPPRGRTPPPPRPSPCRPGLPLPLPQAEKKKNIRNVHQDLNSPRSKKNGPTSELLACEEPPCATSLCPPTPLRTSDLKRFPTGPSPPHTHERAKAAPICHLDVFTSVSITFLRGQILYTPTPPTPHPHTPTPKIPFWGWGVYKTGEGV